MASTSGEEGPPIIIKRVKKIEGGHHGGAWKVAYADFVTAMMAFFLLMWLLNVSTDEQKEAISNYFDPSSPRISDRVSGSGGLLGGQSMATEGAMTSTVQPINNPPVQASRPLGGRSKEGDADDKSQDPGQTDYDSQGFYDDGDPDAAEMNQEDWEDFEDGDQLKTPESIDEIDLAAASQEELERLEEELAEQLEEQRFEEARQDIEVAIEKEIQNNPEFPDLGQHLMMDMTPEGLRIQLIDREGRSMFPSGKADLYDFAQELVDIVAKVIEELPNQLSIRGHTDATPYPEGASYTNWELSADRANALRKALKAGGIATQRVENVVGRAEKEPLLPDDPTAAQNRRISVVLLKEKLTRPAETDTEDEAPTESNAEATEQDSDLTFEPEDSNTEPTTEPSSQTPTDGTDPAPTNAADTPEPAAEEEMIEIEPVTEETEIEEENPLDADDPFALPEDSMSGSDPAVMDEMQNDAPIQDNPADQDNILFF